MTEQLLGWPGNANFGQDPPEADDEVDFGDRTAILSEWICRPLWDVDEATALTLGYDPKYVNSATVPSPADSSLGSRFGALRDFIEEAISWRETPETFSPAFFM